MRGLYTACTLHARANRMHANEQRADTTCRVGIGSLFRTLPNSNTNAADLFVDPTQTRENFWTAEHEKLTAKVSFFYSALNQLLAEINFMVVTENFLEIICTAVFQASDVKTTKKLAFSFRRLAVQTVFHRNNRNCAN